MPMMIPPGQAMMVPVAPGQTVAPGPAHPQAAPHAEPAPQSPFRQEMAPDLVIMPHLEGNPSGPPQKS